MRGISQKALDLAEEVIRASDKQHPADEVLRTLFLRKRGKGAQPKSPSGGGQGPGLPSTEVTGLVFNYYRWRGWASADGDLREQLRETDELALQFKREPGAFTEDDLKTRAVPSWVGAEVSLTPELLRALQSEPRLWLRARAGHGPRIAREFGDTTPFGVGGLADILHYRGAMDLARTPEFYAGDIQIQDINSQAVGLICDPQPGETWWDACVGEGGKMLHLSDLMQNKGLIWASDRSEWRLRKLRTRAGRAKAFNYRSVPWDGGVRPPTKTKFDGVLVDAPCSGAGTWHRNPHARWTTTAEDVLELARLQLDLLANVAASVKPGGKLVYSVCTITRSETDGVADEFEKRFPAMKPMALADPLRPGSAPSARRHFLPQDHGGNGMFVAAWTSGA
jgi:16S rRNA (cytosine967-C5)-methyltransferase